MPLKGYKQTTDHREKVLKKGMNTRFKIGHKLNVGDKNPSKKFGVGDKISVAKSGKPNLNVRGKKSNFWKGGITKKNQGIRNSLEYKLWRKAVFERDNWTCIWCGVRSGNGKTIYLEADHIKPFAYYPELRFAIDNGRTLCKDCHKTTDTYLNKSKKI